MAVRYSKEDVLNLDAKTEEAKVVAGPSGPVADGFPYPPGTTFVTKLMPNYFGQQVSIIVGIYHPEDNTVGFNGVVNPTPGIPTRIEHACPYCHEQFEERAELIYPEVPASDYQTWQDRYPVADFMTFLQNIKAEKVA